MSLERALYRSNEPKNVNKRGRVWRWETQSIPPWFLEADCVSELALSQDQIYMVVYDRRTSAREYETYTPSIPPPKIYIQVWWFLTRWCVQEYMKYNPLPSPHPTSNAPKNYGARYIRKIGHLSGNLIS